MSEQTVAGISRRDLIKKGAIAGGLIWAAPMVTRITPAYALHSGACECHEDQVLYRTTFTMDSGNSFVRVACGSDTAGACNTGCWAAATCTDSLGSASIGGTSSNPTFRITLPAGAEIADWSRQVKSGNSLNCVAGGIEGEDGSGQPYVEWSTPKPANGDVYRVTFCA